MSKDLSLDIETLGVKHNSPILSIGYCWFNYDNPDIEPTGKGYAAFDVEYQTKHQGRVIAADTVKWWMGQSDAARNALFPNQVVLFQSFIERLTKMTDAADAIWAKGPDFDCNILASMIEACSYDYKWPFWKNSCVRTMCNRFPSLHRHIKLDGAAHNALDDAVHQANQIRAIAGAIGHGE